MILTYMKSARKARIAERNYRILSALDDTILQDIGLDRRTLRAFCDNGCAPAATSAGQSGMPRARWLPLSPRPVWG